MCKKHMESRFVNRLPLIIQRRPHFFVFEAQAVDKYIFFRNLHTALFFRVKKCDIRCPAEFPVKRVLFYVIMVSCHKKDSGFRNRGKPFIDLSKLAKQWLPVKKISGYKQQIHRILADTRNNPAECFPDFFFSLVAPGAAPVRNCAQMHIRKMNKSYHAKLLLINRSCLLFSGME